jgi:hypothetical protein
MIHLHKIRLLVLLLFVVKAAFAFDTITGTVHNETTGKPVAGDEVVLLRMGQGMQEESHAKTDAQGAFVLNVATSQASSQAPYLLQVTHQGVTYNQPVKPIRGGASVDLIVYDAVADIPDLAGTIGAVELASDGKILRLRQRYQVINKSNPPVTQFKADNFELSIPANAVFDSVLARWKQGIWLKVTASAIKGKSGKYGINFPIRPGENQFDVTYHLPYNGAATLHLNVPYPVDRFGIMHPPSMSFNTANPAAFKTLGPKNNVVVEMAAASPLVGDVPAFEVSGMGVAPEHETESPAGQAPAPTAAPAAAAPPGNLHAAQNTATTVAEQSGREQWLMIGGIIVLLGGGAFTFWRMTAGRPAVAAGASSGVTQPLLSGLKEELFQLESDRLHGKVSAEEYDATKQALSESIRRAMERKGSS